MGPQHKENHNYHKLRVVGHTLNNYFTTNQGVIMGSTAVVSKKVHLESPKRPGEMGIYRDRDAGRDYLRMDEINRIIHLDILHQPAEINQVDVANRIRRMIPSYLRVIDRSEDWSQEEQDLASTNLTRRIHLYTGMGYGTALDPDQKAVRGTDDRYINHVHVLANLRSKYYSLVYCLIDEIERSISFQGGELRPVLRIIHYGESGNIPMEASSSFYLPPLAGNIPDAVKNQNLLQAVASLAMRMGSIDAVGDFFHALSPMKSLKLGNLQRTHENFEQVLTAMEDSKLIKRSFWGYSLTDTGKELEDFLDRNQKELAAKIRKSIRQFRATPAKYHTLRCSQLKSKERVFANRRKVVTPNNPESWHGEIAISETVIKAAKRSFLTRTAPLQIKPEDIQVYAKKSYAPVDTCLLVDCSGSMMGERIKSVSYIAEYLLLTSREKVGLVTFQETSAEVMVPFTRSYDELHKGLAKVKPNGMTPLAHGINTALDMFKKERPRNPLLVLITDGIPNYPYWTTDAMKDALKAAEMIAREKLRFVCIGIDPDHKFLPLLAEAGHGNIYIVNDSDRNNMIDIITSEKKQYQGSKASG